MSTEPEDAPDGAAVEIAAIGDLADRIAALLRALPSEGASASSERSVAGACFDLLGWLTSRDREHTFSSHHDAAPAVEALRAWAKLRGLSLDDADVMGWRDGVIGPVSPGDPIAEVTCPCCGAALCVEHGEEEGEVVVIGVPVEERAGTAGEDAGLAQECRKSLAALYDVWVGSQDHRPAIHEARLRLFQAAERLERSTLDTREPGAPTVGTMDALGYVAQRDRAVGVASDLADTVLAAHALLTAAGVPDKGLAAGIAALTAMRDEWQRRAEERRDEILSAVRALDTAGVPLGTLAERIQALVRAAPLPLRGLR